MDIGDLESKKLSELRDIGRDMKIPGYTTMKKQDLVFRIMQADAESGGFHFRGGVLAPSFHWRNARLDSQSSANHHGSAVTRRASIGVAWRGAP